MSTVAVLLNSSSCATNTYSHRVDPPSDPEPPLEGKFNTNPEHHLDLGEIRTHFGVARQVPQKTARLNLESLLNAEKVFAEIKASRRSASDVVVSRRTDGSLTFQSMTPTSATSTISDVAGSDEQVGETKTESSLQGGSSAPAMLFTPGPADASPLSAPYHQLLYATADSVLGGRALQELYNVNGIPEGYRLLSVPMVVSFSPGRVTQFDYKGVANVSLGNKHLRDVQIVAVAPGGFSSFANHASSLLDSLSLSIGAAVPLSSVLASGNLGTTLEELHKFAEVVRQPEFHVAITGKETMVVTYNGTSFTKVGKYKRTSPMSQLVDTAFAAEVLILARDPTSGELVEDEKLRLEDELRLQSEKSRLEAELNNLDEELNRLVDKKKREDKLKEQEDKLKELEGLKKELEVLKLLKELKDKKKELEDKRRELEGEGENKCSAKARGNATSPGTEVPGSCEESLADGNQPPQAQVEVLSTPASSDASPEEPTIGAVQQLEYASTWFFAPTKAFRRSTKKENRWNPEDYGSWPDPHDNDTGSISAQYPPAAPVALVSVLGVQRVPEERKLLTIDLDVLSKVGTGGRPKFLCFSALGGTDPANLTAQTAAFPVPKNRGTQKALLSFTDPVSTAKIPIRVRPVKSAEDCTTTVKNGQNWRFFSLAASQTKPAEPKKISLAGSEGYLHASRISVRLDLEGPVDINSVSIFINGRPATIDKTLTKKDQNKQVASATVFASIADPTDAKHTTYRVLDIQVDVMPASLTKDEVRAKVPKRKAVAFSKRTSVVAAW